MQNQFINPDWTRVRKNGSAPSSFPGNLALMFSSLNDTNSHHRIHFCALNGYLHEFSKPVCELPDAAEYSPVNALLCDEVET